MTKDTALLIIDVQRGLIEPAYRSKEVMDAINSLLTRARTTATPVVYVQHDGPLGHGLEVGTAAWQIHPAIAPKEGEPVIHKRASDSFYDTPLQRELEARGVKHLVVVGGQTDYCIDTTCRRATTMGYTVTLVADAHTTEDNDLLTAAQVVAYHNYMLDGFKTDEYAIHVKPTEEIHF